MLDVLRAIAPIAHFTIWPPRDAHDDDLSTPPIIWWTYQHPSEAIAVFLHRTVNEFQGEIAWELLTASRRWILMPARIREHAELHGCDGDLVAAAELQETDPDFGERANAELRLLAEHIYRRKREAG